VDADALLVLGKVIGAHGVRGLVKMMFFSGSAPRCLVPEADIRLRRAKGETAVYKVLEVTSHRGHFLVRLDRVDDRDTAEALIGAEMMVARSDLPDPGEDNFYWSDLIGMEVLTGEGRRLGELVGIIETGSNDVFRVRSGRREVMVPALASVVRRIDLQGGRMWVDLPEGL
jgi:16S rRNA processing protein RimM